MPAYRTTCHILAPPDFGGCKRASVQRIEMSGSRRSARSILRDEMEKQRRRLRAVLTLDGQFELGKGPCQKRPIHYSRRSHTIAFFRYLAFYLGWVKQLFVELLARPEPCKSDVDVHVRPEAG